MTIRFDDGDVLLCPGCGLGNLRHGDTRVHSRQSGEDSAVVTTQGARVLKPHGRRDALLIDFSCEQCAARPRLRIMQHKGSTYVAWLNPADDKPFTIG